MTLDEVIEACKGLSAADISLLRVELDAMMKKKAEKELERREAELNDLRVLAGLRRRPKRKK